MHNACIVSLFMTNVDNETAKIQKQVVDKFNRSRYPHYHLQMPAQPRNAHPTMMDYFWNLNGQKVKTPMLQVEIEKIFNHDIVLFLDIDAIPLREHAIDDVIEKAANGYLAGNIQRSGHIENNQHVFVAPSVLAVSVETFNKLGMPSAEPTSRGDVAEEYTYSAEKVGVPLSFYMPTKYDQPPIRMSWEKNQEPFWRLVDGMPNYGMGTTYGDDSNEELFYHNFQIFHGDNQIMFKNKCESVLGV